MKLHTIRVVQEDCFSWAALKFEPVFCSETLMPVYQSAWCLICEGGKLQVQNSLEVVLCVSFSSASLAPNRDAGVTFVFTNAVFN